MGCCGSKPSKSHHKKLDRKLSSSSTSSSRESESENSQKVPISVIVPKQTLSSIPLMSKISTSKVIPNPILKGVSEFDPQAGSYISTTSSIVGNNSSIASTGGGGSSVLASQINPNQYSSTMYPSNMATSSVANSMISAQSALSNYPNSSFVGSNYGSSMIGGSSAFESNYSNASNISNLSNIGGSKANSFVSNMSNFDSNFSNISNIGGSKANSFVSNVSRIPFSSNISNVSNIGGSKANSFVSNVSQIPIDSYAGGGVGGSKFQSSTIDSTIMPKLESNYQPISSIVSGVQTKISAASTLSNLSGKLSKIPQPPPQKQPPLLNPKEIYNKYISDHKKSQNKTLK
ncbi:26S protease regulatory subunit 4 [Sarcoptes scabiei]|nr:26S protease regulatory subunit 4 [Sarcoptes scabiei]